LGPQESTTNVRTNMFKTLEAKIKLSWTVWRSSSVQMIYQRYPGAAPRGIGYGKADLKDLVMIAKEIGNLHEEFTDMIQEMASHTGSLHDLQSLQEAVNVIEEDKDGRN